ncbi:ribosomal-protein-alanine N-acetyltransferase [Geothermobacter hydrogeniphilus]|uniref:[Ribosomal protein bS18]-alanine N-acetyltransferase n=1 Tax=Geothermobacter hydrogeniphilus TaxID=1969733 RepID=A0A2K2HCB1_9BACT|nr:ribosomal protein S18-alanine N-acetyltransferase [Geothermobacter hydrogeniphilus]PNU20948.1 ribosomal-protein-alanine N-acetyltransferase [Geothermobacter hydrogeniphilus]
MNRLYIRRLTADDLEKITALERRCQPHPWSRELFCRELGNPVARFHVAELAGSIAGYLCCWQIGDELEIHNVATDPDYRRRGIARRLLAGVLADPGVARVFLEVRSGNRGAIALYRALGFRVSDCRRGYYHDGEDALLMDWRRPGPD